MNIGKSVLYLVYKSRCDQNKNYISYDEFKLKFNDTEAAKSGFLFIGIFCLIPPDIFEIEANPNSLIMLNKIR